MWIWRTSQRPISEKLGLQYYWEVMETLRSEAYSLEAYSWGEMCGLEHSHERIHCVLQQAPPRKSCPHHRPKGCRSTDNHELKTVAKINILSYRLITSGIYYNNRKLANTDVYCVLIGWCKSHVCATDDDKCVWSQGACLPSAWGTWVSQLTKKQKQIIVYALIKTY